MAELTAEEIQPTQMHFVVLTKMFSSGIRLRYRPKTWPITKMTETVNF